MSPTAPFLPTAEEMGERTPAETAFLHFLSALYRLSMQSCAPTQSAFSYPLSFRRLCQHSFPLPLPVATVNSFVLSCYGTTNISHPVPAGHTYLCRRASAKARFDNRPTSGGGFKRRGPKPPPLSLQGDRILKERGKFEIPLSLSGVLWLLSFDMKRKQLAPAGATPARRRGGETPPTR